MPRSVFIASPSVTQTAAVLATLRDVIVSGAFVHTPDKEACKWCDYTVACGDRVQERAAAKATDTKLVAFGKLAAYV